MAEDETFKVTDRRRREQADEPLTAPARPDAAAPAPPSAPGAGAQGSAPWPQGGADLRSLFIMLASSALVNLGDAADPQSGERVLDLEQAKEAIDLLSILRVKTEGNRTDQESHLLEEMLYDLHLRFVRAAKGTTGG